MKKLILAFTTAVILTGCVSIPDWMKVEVATVSPALVCPVITMPGRPDKLQLLDIKWLVWNKEKLQQAATTMTDSDAYVVLTVKEYENLSRNYADIKRYIQDQSNIYNDLESKVNNAADRQSAETNQPKTQ